MEDLRQLCIWRLADRKKNHVLFFRYLENFLQLTSDGMPNEYNSNRAMDTSMLIDKDFVNQCVKDSFEGGKDMEIDDNTDLRMM